MDRVCDRKMIDCYRFYINYGNGWEHELTEYTRSGMKRQQRIYAKKGSKIRINRTKEPITTENKRYLGKFYK